MNTKHVSVPLTLKAGNTAGSVQAVFSVFDEVDSDGDVVLASAFTDGQEVPLVWSHDWTSPVGKGVIRVEPTRAVFDGVFNLNTTAGRDAYETVKFQGDLQEFSWGFQIKESEMGQLDGQRVRFIKDVEVFEVSPVLVGANRNTGTLAIKAGTLPPVTIELDSQTIAARIDPEPEVASAPAPTIPDGTINLTSDDLQRKRAIGAHSTGTSDGSWDGPANRRRLPASAAALRRAHAWLDPDGDADAKSAYRFIHHEVSGEGTVGAANLTACSTGIGILNGGRGGTTIPDADRRGVYAHLAKHLRDGGREAPPLKSAAELEAVEKAAARGSYEALIETLTLTLTDQFAGPRDAYVAPVATYPGRVVCVVMNWDEREPHYYSVDYAVGLDGEITLGDAEEVEQTFVPVGGKASSFVVHLERALADVLAVIGRTKSLADLRAKRGAAISTERRGRLAQYPPALREAAQRARDVADDIEALLEETAPKQRATVLRLRAEFDRMSARLTRDLGVLA